MVDSILAQQQELWHQHTLAKTDKERQEIERLIAGLEKQKPKDKVLLK